MAAQAHINGKVNGVVKHNGCSAFSRWNIILASTFGERQSDRDTRGGVAFKNVLILAF